MQTLLPVSALLLSTALLLTGHGLQLTLLPLRAELLEFGARTIGLTASAYFAGFALGCFAGAQVIRRAGHIRSFAILAAVNTAALLALNMTDLPWAWLALRFATGIGIAGLYMVIESWLAERAEASNRGRLFSIYTVINLSTLTLGQLLINVGDVGGGLLFSLAAMFMVLSIVPVSATTSLQPAPVARIGVRIGLLFGSAPTAAIGALTSGLVTGAFWALAPVYTSRMGLDIAQTTVFMSATIIGGAVFQYPLGVLSDHHDRRFVLTAVLLACAFASALLGVAGDLGAVPLYGFGFVFGGTAMTIYALAVAHANDHTADSDFVQIASTVLLLYALGAVAGPIAAAAAMALAGAGGLFLFCAGAALLTAVLAMLRILVRPRQAAQAPFRSVPDATPEAFALDPRSEADPDAMTGAVENAAPATLDASRTNVDTVRV